MRWNVLSSILMKILIEKIPHRSQRYDTVGDYFYDLDHLSIKVSDMKNENYEFLVAIHELIESHLCSKRKISEEDISKYDIAFEEVRANFSTLIGDQEPGDMIAAPYNKEHLFATKIEKMIADELGVDWDRYEKKVNSL